MPFLALLSGGKMILYGAIAVAVLGAWAAWEYRGNKIERLEATVALRAAEIASVAEDANKNAAAAARLREEWKRADAVVATRDKELTDVRNRLKAARNAANAVPVSACTTGSPRLALLAERLRRPSAGPVDGAGGRGSAPIPAGRPARPGVPGS